MNFLQLHLLVILIVWGYLLLLCGLLLAAAFRWFKPSPHSPASKLVLMACWSFLGFVSGCFLVAIYWHLFEQARIDVVFSILPAGWLEVHFVATTIGCCWGGGLLGALAGRRLWRRRLHEPR